MRDKAEFEIPYTGLGLGQHAFDFRLDEAFFQTFDPEGLVDADITAETVLDRFDEMMHYDVRVTGTVQAACDRCNAPMTVDIECRTRYVIQFGSDTHKTDDDILVLGPQEHLLDVREFLYETTMLGMPLRRVHGNIDDCDPQVVQWLTGSVDHAPDEEVQEEKKENDIDPRWAALKGLTSEEEKEGGEPN